MKRLLIFLLLLPSLAWSAEPIEVARMNPYILGGGVAAAASTFCSSATATASTTGVLCEDFEGSTECASTYSSNCRAAWSVGLGTPDFDYATPIAGTYSLNLPAYTNAAAIGLHRNWTYNSSTTYYGYMKIKAVNIPAVSTSQMLFSLKESSSNRCYVLWKNNGSAVVWAVAAGSGTGAETVDTVSEGSTYNLWFKFVPGSGSNAECHIAVSTTTTKPSDPSNGYAKSTDGTATSSIDNIFLEPSYSSVGQCNDLVVDDIFIDDADITGVPN